MSKRAGLAIFSQLDYQTDVTLFAVRNHELWKAHSSSFICQGCKRPIDDNHFACGSCHADLPTWNSVATELDVMAQDAWIPRRFWWWRFSCKTDQKDVRGCQVHKSLADFTCLNAVLAEIPACIDPWIREQGHWEGNVRKAILRIQRRIAKYVLQRRQLLYPKQYHPK